MLSLRVMCAEAALRLRKRPMLVEALVGSARAGRLSVVRRLTDDDSGDWWNTLPTPGPFIHIDHVTRDSALVEAAKGGHVAVVRYLSGHCFANTHAWDCDALLWAVAGGHLAVVQLLATDACYEPDLWSALLGAVHGRRKAVVEWLVSPQSGLHWDAAKLREYIASLPPSNMRACLARAARPAKRPAKRRRQR